MEAINERFKGGSIADSCSQLYLRPPVHPEDAQGAFSCCRGDGSFESYRNRVGFVGEPRVIRVGFVGAARGNRVGAAWERRWIQGEPALDPCHLRVRSRRYH